MIKNKLHPVDGINHSSKQPDWIKFTPADLASAQQQQQYTLSRPHPSFNTPHAKDPFNTNNVVSTWLKTRLGLVLTNPIVLHFIHPPSITPFHQNPSPYLYVYTNIPPLYPPSLLHWSQIHGRFDPSHPASDHSFLSIPFNTLSLSIFFHSKFVRVCYSSWIGFFGLVWTGQKLVPLTIAASIIFSPSLVTRQYHLVIGGKKEWMWWSVQGIRKEKRIKRRMECWRVERREALHLP